MDVDLETDETIRTKMKFHVKRERRMYMYSMSVGHCKFKSDTGILKDYMVILFFVTLQILSTSISV